MNEETIVILLILFVVSMVVMKIIMREERITRIEKIRANPNTNMVGLYSTRVDGKKILAIAISYHYFVNSLPSVLSFCNTNDFVSVPGGFKISCDNGEEVIMEKEGAIVYLNGSYSVYNFNDFRHDFNFMYWIDWSQMGVG